MTRIFKKWIFLYSAVEPQRIGYYYSYAVLMVIRCLVILSPHFPRSCYSFFDGNRACKASRNRASRCITCSRDSNAFGIGYKISCKDGVLSLSSFGWAKKKFHEIATISQPWKDDLANKISSTIELVIVGSIFVILSKAISKKHWAVFKKVSDFLQACKNHPHSCYSSDIKRNYYPSSWENTASTCTNSFFFHRADCPV